MMLGSGEKFEKLKAKYGDPEAAAAAISGQEKGPSAKGTAPKK
jgi:hypothetical protein